MTTALTVRNIGEMDRSSALRLLPTLHAVAIRLRDDGQSDHVIAVALEIEDDQVPVLLRIANRKLNNLMAMEDTGTLAPAGQAPSS
jgi:hypothetical protein